ncbi:MAG: dUTP diphosphatase [Rhodothalassiaceae bacterium]
MAIDPTPRVEIRVLDVRLRDWGPPDYQTPLSAAIDLHACIDAPLRLAAGEPPALISSGIAVHMDNAHMAALVLPRSGLGHKKGLVLGNLTGLIDADYMAPIYVSLWNRNPPGSEPILVEPGERIAQLLFVPVLRPAFAFVDSFSGSSARGEGGFGSTGTAPALPHAAGARASG